MQLVSGFGFQDEIIPDTLFLSRMNLRRRVESLNSDENYTCCRNKTYVNK